MSHIYDHPLFENIANRCGVKTCHWPLMDVKTIPELLGGGGSENNHCSEMGPNTKPQSFNEKIAVTLQSQ